jgi:hypothetical protein
MMLRCSIAGAAVVLPIALACGGMGPPPDDDAGDAPLKVWSASPGGSEPKIELRLILDDRVAVYADGKHTGELDVPAVPEDRRDASQQVLVGMDVDADGLKDIGFRDDDQSGVINGVYAFYRYDHSARSYRRCTDLDGWPNLEVNRDGGLISTNLGNGVGSSGATTWLRSDGGCGFTPIATLTWEVSLQSGNGSAHCTLWGEEEPQWRMPVNERPSRACPEQADEAEPGEPDATE